MQEIGKALFIIGLLLAAAGFFLWKIGGRLPLGKLPGDIAIQKPNFSFYFPITTCIIISVVLTLILWLFRR
jgi:membrane protein implicated in regulation of membrane protease activity